jgi:hypothetical protein
MLATIEKRYGRSIEPSFVLENPTIRGMANYLALTPSAADETGAQPFTNGTSGTA